MWKDKHPKRFSILLFLIIVVRRSRRFIPKEKEEEKKEEKNTHTHTHTKIDTT